MTRKVLLHVGTPKTGTSYLQDVLFRNKRAARRARHPLPRRPVRRALPGRPRPDAAAVGRPRARGRRRLGPARREVRDWARRDRDHQPRDPRRAPRARRSGGRWSRWGTSATARRRRGAPGALGARPGAPDPRRVAGERQAPQRDELRPVPRADHRPGPQQPDRVVVLERPGGPRDPRPLGRRPAARAHPPGDRAVARRRARPALEAVQPGLRARGHRPRPRGRAGQPVARRPGDRADPADQPRGQPRRSSPPTTDRSSASCWPTRRCRAGCCRRGWRCRPRTVPWVAGARGGVRRRDRAARLRRRRRPPRPARQRRRCTRTSTPTSRASATSPAPPSTPSRRCCSRTPGCAREEARLRGGARRDPCTRCRAPTCGRRTGPARRP